VAGAAAALVLPLVVFAGGAEATITGAMLLGFGLGWALMATFTVRCTQQPQRWAFVPAAAMGAAGAAAITSTTKEYRNQRDEVSVLPELFTQAQALTTFGDRPLAVLTASATSDGTDGWDGAQDQLAALSTSSVHRTVDSTHTGLLEDPAPAAESVRAITEVVSSVRTGRPLGR
jgi:hypothetical protein